MPNFCSPFLLDKVQCFDLVKFSLYSDKLGMISQSIFIYVVNWQLEGLRELIPKKRFTLKGTNITKTTWKYLCDLIHDFYNIGHGLMQSRHIYNFLLYSVILNVGWISKKSGEKSFLTLTHPSQRDLWSIPFSHSTSHVKSPNNNGLSWMREKEKGRK